MVIICRFGLLLVPLPWAGEKIRVSDTFNSIVTCLKELFDISRRDSISLIIRNVITEFLTSRRDRGRGPVGANSSSIDPAVAVIFCGRGHQPQVC